MKNESAFTAQDMLAIGEAMSSIGKALTAMSAVFAGAGARMSKYGGVSQEDEDSMAYVPVPNTAKPASVRLDEIRTEVKKPGPVFKPADQAYSDLPRCGTCQRPMRPIGSKAADWPGTINKITSKICGTCYARERNRKDGAIPRKRNTVAQPAPDLSQVFPKPAAPTQPALVPVGPAPKPAEKATPSIWAQNVRQLGEKKEREKQERLQATQRAKYAALHAEAEQRATAKPFDEKTEKERQAKADHEAFLAGRRKRQAAATGVRMPGEAEDKPHGSQT